MLHLTPKFFQGRSDPPRRQRALFNTFFGGVFFFLFLATANSATHVIPLSQEIVHGDTLGVSPGDIIQLSPGRRGNMRFTKINGTADNPVIVENTGGQVIIDGSDAASLVEGVVFDQCNHFEFRGDGVAGLPYGIKITNATHHGISFAPFTSDFVMCYIEIANVDSSGINAKTETGRYIIDGVERLAVEGEFTMRNVDIHNNYVHGVVHEGMYCGHSNYDNTTLVDGVPYYRHSVANIDIYDNIVTDCGWDGIQVGSAIGGSRIFNNTVCNTGTLQVFGQRAGIQINPGSRMECFNNLVKDGNGGAGIFDLGLGDCEIYNNMIIRPGGVGILSADRNRSVPGTHRIFNNTIILSESHPLAAYGHITTKDYRNNLILLQAIDSDQIYINDGGVPVVVQNNLLTHHLASLAFSDPTRDDYRLTNGSTAIDGGEDLSSLGVTADLFGGPRPAGNAYDLGAHESGNLSVQTVITRPTRYQSPNGSIELHTIGGTPPYSVAWSDGASGSQRSGLIGGINYAYTITDSDSNSIDGIVRLTQPDAVEVAADIIAETDHASNGSIALRIRGGIAPYSVQWNHGPTTESLSSLPTGTYSCTVNDSAGAQASDSFYVPNGGSVVLRINCAGPELVDNQLNWTTDDPTSTYLVDDQWVFKSGPPNFNGPNTTSAPKDIFGRFRYVAPTRPEPINWSVPIANGLYQITLFFREPLPPTSISAGDRVFDVVIEDEIALDDLDVFANHGNAPSAYQMERYVDDGFLNIDIISMVGGGMIHGIEVRSISGRTFANWLALYPSIPAGSLPDDDIDGDGLSLIVEQVYGFEPLQSYRQLNNRAMQTTTEGGALAITLKVPGSFPSDIICEIQTSTSLEAQSWSTITQRSGSSDWTHSSWVSIKRNEFDEIAITPPTPERRFFRLKVEQVAP
ncbi:MAG: malectin domain-containing carbohydrate-binding protein [Verrucomicrobiota bacterium]